MDKNLTENQEVDLVDDKNSAKIVVGDTVSEEVETSEKVDIEKKAELNGSEKVDTEIKGNDLMIKKQTVFTTKNIAGMAIFTALAYATYFLEIPIFASTPVSFLKLDFSCVFILLAGFMYGPLPAIIITVIKEALHIPVGTTLGVGELANVLMTLAYILVPTITYRRKKGIKVVLLTIGIGCVLQVLVSLIVNKFINYPFFSFMFGGSIFGHTATEFFAMTWWYILLFNVIKSVAVSVVTILLYKRVSKLFKRIKLHNA